MEQLENKKFKSIVRRVVLLPLLVMAIIGLVSISACLVTFFNVQKQIIRSNQESLQIAQNQMDNLISQIEMRYYRYWASNAIFTALNNQKEDVKIEVYAVSLADNATWMNELDSDFGEIEGVFSYYSNIEQLQFRGNSNLFVQNWIREALKNSAIVFDCWRIIEVNENYYLIDIKNRGNHYCGVWIPIDNVKKEFMLDSQNYDGELFLQDQLGVSTLESVKETDGEHIYYADAKGKNVQIGIVIDNKRVLEAVPKLIYVLLGVMLLSIAMIPIVLVWLRQRISKPIAVIDRAMQFVGEGNVDYRLSIGNGESYDEFDRLSVRINQTLDELNEISYNLYETQLSAQRNRITYLMQQIRPHFILNALNIIYTYDETEFPLIKKMVLYLTEYFRYIVNVRKDFVELIDEMHHVQNYLNIQKERYANRFDSFVEWEVETEHIYIPPLIIQTFVENCIKYGMRDDVLTLIYVLARREGDVLKLMIADTGNGFSADVLKQFDDFAKTHQHQEGLGVGMENVLEGMTILYGEGNYQIHLRNALSGGAIVELELPVKEEE